MAEGTQDNDQRPDVRIAMENAELREKVDHVVDMLKKEAFNVIILGTAKLNPTAITSGVMHDIHNNVQEWLEALRRNVCGDMVNRDGSITKKHQRALTSTKG